ncbi:MAG: hypothetical protein VB064_12885 [Oscillospiraceae bacterium]|nr:hypothetical protein [Oscillospiraceae bacterium]
MTLTEIRARLDEFCNIFRFEYQGLNCYLDPVSRYDKWIVDVVCGDDYKSVSLDSLDAVLSAPLFVGKSLAEIYNDIDIIEM